jgi:cytochrome P450
VLVTGIGALKEHPSWRDAGCDPTTWNPPGEAWLSPNPAVLRPLPTTPAVSGVLETLSFLRDPDFARSRFERYGDVYGTTLLGQRTVFIRGQRAINDLFVQADAVEGWWPESVRKLLGPLSLANRNGADHKARRRVVGQLFASAALKR